RRLNRSEKVSPRPLPACPADEAVRRLHPLLPHSLIHRHRLPQATSPKWGLPDQAVAQELLHLPAKPAGVELGWLCPDLAGELVHLPAKPAGVRRPALANPSLGSLHLYLCGTTRATLWEERSPPSPSPERAQPVRGM